VNIRRKPDEKIRTIREASHITNTPMETVKRQLEQFGEFRSEHYIVSLLAPNEQPPMTVFQQYFDAMGHAIRVVVISKRTKVPRTVTLSVAATMTGISCGSLTEEMRVSNSYEDKDFEVHFSPLDNGPEHMPKRT
jgi:hypothetical protein